jgi:hypothetical protein
MNTLAGAAIRLTFAENRPMEEEGESARRKAMRRSVLFVVWLAGCSTHPVADFMDYVARPGGVRGPGRAGVCQPAPALTATAPVAPAGARIEAPSPEPPAVPR